MKRHIYKGYVIDTDQLGRPYIYNTVSPYAEDSDRLYVYVDRKKPYTLIKAIIDERISTGKDCDRAFIDAAGRIIVE